MQYFTSLLQNQVSSNLFLFQDLMDFTSLIIIEAFLVLTFLQIEQHPHLMKYAIQNLRLLHQSQVQIITQNTS